MTKWELTKINIDDLKIEQKQTKINDLKNKINKINIKNKLTENKNSNNFYQDCVKKYVPKTS